MSSNTVLIARGGVERGCGANRTPGGVYLEHGIGAAGRGKTVKQSVQDTGGVYFQQMLVDPPRPYDTEQKLGVDLIQDPHTGVWHVFDWIGASHYPMPSDFLEEGKVHGFSRKVSKSLEFNKLTAQSKLVFIHPKAIVLNAAEIIPHLPESKLKSRCAHYAATGNEAHFEDPTVSCTRLWYALTEANSTRLTSEGMLLPERKIGETTYLVEPLPMAAPEPVFAPGIIATVPLSNISVIRAGNGSHKATIGKITEMTLGNGLTICERNN